MHVGSVYVVGTWAINARIRVSIIPDPYIYNYIYIIIYIYLIYHYLVGG